ncbi:alkylphosphocholine resistance protein lem3 [Blastocladiella emersonii ATCC 22665]|nr:alkylphosphocholine resistance protein lem3 [Blastocladiella emersonii ATCC 22665]
MSDEKPKTRRPANTAFKQQRLKAWQPLLTPKSVLPTLFILGVIFAPLGAFLLHTSNSVTELIIDYTDCAVDAGTAFRAPSKMVTAFSAPGVSGSGDLNFQWKYKNATTSSASDRNTCTVQFNLPVALDKSVFLYYRLTNFYQNHRRYVKSFDAAQLKGQPVTAAAVKTNCHPLGQIGDTNAMYYPCGLIADSMFNDTIKDPVSSSGQTYTFSPKGIAWPADAAKYGAPANFDPATHIPPPNWVKRYNNGTGKYDKAPDLASDERFQVWMRTAGLPNFRKLYGRNDKDILAAGTYTMEIEDNFEVKSFGGTKSVVISTVSFMGGKNPFLGYAYIVVGAVCIILAVVFAARHLYSPRKLGDHTYLSWNHQPPPAQ